MVVLCHTVPSLLVIDDVSHLSSTSGLNGIWQRPEEIVSKMTTNNPISFNITQGYNLRY